MPTVQQGQLRSCSLLFKVERALILCSPWTTVSSSQLRRRTLVRTMRGPRLPRGPGGTTCFCASDFAFSDLQSFASQHCPVFYLHPEEEYFPSSFDEFLEHCQLYFHYDPVLTKVTPAALLRHTRKLAVSSLHQEYIARNRLLL